jgi:hypothetical protein
VGNLRVVTQSGATRDVRPTFAPRPLTVDRAGIPPSNYPFRPPSALYALPRSPSAAGAIPSVRAARIPIGSVTIRLAAPRPGMPVAIAPALQNSVPTALESRIPLAR